MSKNNHGGVWAKRRKPKINLRLASSKEVEDLIVSKFNGGFPVILSSGRGAIKLIMQEFWTAQDVSIFQFASQCVVNAIQAASVTPYSCTDFTSDIIYHQWGYSDPKRESEPFIEDSCDTFLAEGSSVLRLGGQFELWSLPKILNSRFGAIVWCKNDKDAQHLRVVRDKAKESDVRKKQIYRSLRIINSWTYRIWEISEYKTFKLSKNEYGLLKKDISEWKEKYIERLELANRAYSFLNHKYQDYFEKPFNLAAREQLKFAPVVILLDSQKADEEFLTENTFEILHRIESAKKPQKYMVYKFLQDDKLIC
jgi:putative PLP-dependent aminotransferase (TIGR04422 family)